VVKFAELVTLPRTQGGLLDRQAVERLLPHVPDDVLTQVVIDHGTKPEFQRQYADLDFDAIRWELRYFTASKLVTASTYEQFAEWVDTVSRRTHAVRNYDWNSIDVRNEVVENWRVNHTWLRPPVFLEADLLGRDPGVHLMEGHTRLGILRGLVAGGIIRPSSLHMAWLGVAYI